MKFKNFKNVTELWSAVPPLFKDFTSLIVHHTASPYFCESSDLNSGNSFSQQKYFKETDQYFNLSSLTVQIFDT